MFLLQNIRVSGYVVYSPFRAQETVQRVLKVMTTFACWTSLLKAPISSNETQRTPGEEVKVALRFIKFRMLCCVVRECVNKKIRIVFFPVEEELKTYPIGESDVFWFGFCCWYGWREHETYVDCCSSSTDYRTHFEHVAECFVVHVSLKSGLGHCVEM